VRLQIILYFTIINSESINPNCVCVCVCVCVSLGFKISFETIFTQKLLINFPNN